MSCTISRCRLAACNLETSLASDRRCRNFARRSSRREALRFRDGTGLAILQIENALYIFNDRGSLRDGNDYAVQAGFDFGLEFLLNYSRWTISVQCLKIIDLLHSPELLLNLLLISHETVVHIAGPIHIHARFPVVEHGVLPKITLQKYFGTDFNVKNG